MESIGFNRVQSVESGDASRPRTLRFSQLSRYRKSLLRLCQAVNFGSIHELEIKDSEPVLSPQVVVLVDMKLDGTSGSRSELELADFSLCHEACILMQLFDKMKHAKLDRIEVRAGTPRRVIFRSQPAGLLQQFDSADWYRSS